MGALTVPACCQTPRRCSGPRRGACLWRSRAPGSRAARGLLLALSNLLFSSALARVPRAYATAAGFASPVLTVALAAVWLGGPVGWRRRAGVGTGLLGVAVALRPPALTGGAPPHRAMVPPLGTATLFAVCQIPTRELVAVDDPRTAVLHTGSTAAGATSLAQPLFWTAPPPGVVAGEPRPPSPARRPAPRRR